MASSSKKGPAAAVGPVKLADTLGIASAALGAPMLVAPRRLLREIGIKDDDQAVRWTRIVGAREFLATFNINANRQRRIGMWSRVAGDTMDLGLLVSAFRHKRKDAGRLQGAIAFVGALALVDLLTAIAFTRADGSLERDGAGSTGEGADHDTGGGPTRVRTALTIRGSEEEIRAAYESFGFESFDARALLDAGEVRFAAAPRDRGTELHLDHEPGGLAPRVAKLVGQSPDQGINDELRRFKAFVETGVLVRSETSPEGVSAKRQILHKGQPAQPVAKGS